jgi:subtilase family serine protease
MQCDVLVEDIPVDHYIPDGWGPPNFQAAYNLPPGILGTGQVVGIVDAFDNPNVAPDLATYRKEFKLGNAHFNKYNQKGEQGHYPAKDAGWGIEIDLDVEMVSAVCPRCTIDLIEANTAGTKNLFAAEREAVKLGATIVNSSWGGTATDAGDTFSKPGILYVASAGDSGYGVQSPAELPTVVSVGGTILVQSGSRYDETVWPDGGGGCSVVAKPSWQSDPDCKNRTGNDISAVAFHAAEYDTDSEPGWITVRGTSVASPLVAGMFALAGNAGKQYGGKNLWLLTARQHKRDFHTNITGSINKCPPEYESTYICTGGTGQFGTYSGPAGWGSPKGIGAL